ncbi:hypothetical protein F4V43_01615 [Paenibacillus spiritus]|uniref:Uncharacterized protein n=1 Tax=Paenibacillus spiritus TaxID=2496557 RepID=A0A5J5GGS3_9BACL|nr:hypothetical protein [Paenibacillus spiritus]KAA9007210.1 hypothetical protein F4V43_01615 [Paenibacillus spiritus]
MSADKLKKLKETGEISGLTPEKKKILKEILDKMKEANSNLWRRAYNNLNKEYQTLVVDDDKQATHWRALPDTREDGSDAITIGKLYRLYWDYFDNEYVILNDNKQFSTIYMWHNGEWVVMEGSKRWQDLNR